MAGAEKSLVQQVLEAREEEGQKAFSKWRIRNSSDDTDYERWKECISNMDDVRDSLDATLNPPKV